MQAAECHLTCAAAGVHVDIPVLTPKDVNDLQQFCVKNNMDFVAASFVQVGGPRRGHCLRHPVRPACK
jgi:pyruvate kinase